MSNNIYPPLGPPPKQPRNSKFTPKIDRKGHGEIDPNLANIPTTTRNIDILKKFGVDEMADMEVSVKTGDVLIAAQPFVCVLSTSCRGIRCDNCFKKFDRKTAIVCDCKFAWFCSTECRQADTLHVEECQLLIKCGKPPTSDITRYILRAILKIKSGGLSEGDIVPGYPGTRKFFELVDHFDDILHHSGHRLDTIENSYREIIDYMGEACAPSPDYFLTIYGRIAVNSFSIVDGPEQDSIGSGLYLGPSVFDHSCVPNAAATFMPDKTIVIRALEDMPNRNISNFFITYIDLMDHTGHRRDHLQRNYYFLCQCARCSDSKSDRDMFTIVCKKCLKPDIFVGSIEVVPEILKCSNCNEIHPEEDRQNYIDICEIVRDKLAEVQVPMDVANFCLIQMSRSGFGPFHIFVVQSTLAAFEGCIFMYEKSRNNLELVKKAHGYGLVMLEAYEKFKPGKIWSCQGLFLAKMSQIERKLGMEKEAETHSKMADEILTICYGGNVVRDLKSMSLN